MQGDRNNDDNNVDDKGPEDGDDTKKTIAMVAKLMASVKKIKVKVYNIQLFVLFCFVFLQ